MSEELGLTLQRTNGTEVGVHLLKEPRIWFEREPVQVVVDELLDTLKGEVDHHAVPKGGYVRWEVWLVQEVVLSIGDLSVERHLVTPPGHEEHWGHEGHLFLGSCTWLHFYLKLIIIRLVGQIN